MSNGKAKWYNDLALVRERLDGRGASLRDLQDLFNQLGLQKVVDELALTVQVLGECANSVNNSIQEVSTTLNEMGYELQEAKKRASGPVNALETTTGNLREFQNEAAIPPGWVRVQRVIEDDAQKFTPWTRSILRLKKPKRKGKK